MSDEKKSHKLMNQTDRGQKSEALMSTLKETFEELEIQCYEKFLSSSIHDSEGHKTCVIYRKVLDDVRDRLETSIIQGKSATKELKTLTELEKPKGD